MDLLLKIKAASLDARKTKDVDAPFLVMILSDIFSYAKGDGNREPTDEDADKIVRSSVKGIDKALDGIPAETDYAIQMARRRDLLKAFVPAPLEGDSLAMAVRSAADFCDTPIEVKSMGKIMARLKELYPGLVDGAQVKNLLQTGAC